MNRSSSATARERPLVLHIDADAARRAMLSSGLAEAGFDIRSVSDDAEANARLIDCTPDLLVVAEHVPAARTIEWLTCAHRHEAGADVPVLAIIDPADRLDDHPVDADMVTRIYAAGASDVVIGAVDPIALAPRLRHLLRAKGEREALLAERAVFETAQRIACLGSWEWCARTRRLHWSREFGRILGLPEHDRHGGWTRLIERVDEEDRESLEAVALLAMRDGKAINTEFRIRDPEGGDSLRTVRALGEPVTEGAASGYAVIGTLQDITEPTDAQAQIHNLAYYDLVTGLPNRANLHEQMRRVLKRAERSGEEFAILFLDLDHFKQVNDTLGHDAGDDLLKQVSERLLAVVRESDTVGRAGEVGALDEDSVHTVARLGGDEFVVLLGCVDRVEDAARVAQRIAASIGQPYMVCETRIGVTTTIGIGTYPADGADVETLLKHADIAMYHAKENGRNGYQFYSRGIHEKALARFSMERELRQGIERGELHVVYQPKVALATGKLSGVEALVRWQHPEKGDVSPGDFIPLAEETGLILQIGQFVLREVCLQRRRWSKAGLAPFPIAVNCSSVQFLRGDLIGDIDAAISESGLEPHWLEIELTESLLLQDIDAGIASLEKMKRLGVQISIDDFGKGFSALSYLKHLPVDKLKVDESFINNLVEDAGDAAIVSAIIALGHHLDLSVVAEGVETREQYDILNGYGCHEAQGYLIGRPMEAETFERWQGEREIEPLRIVSGL